MEEEAKPVRLTAKGEPRKPGKRGGARPGAGRPPKNPPKIEETYYVEDGRMSMLEFLRLTALGHIEPTALQVAAARTAVQYEEVKTGDGGKKESRQREAEAIGGTAGLAPTPPPGTKPQLKAVP